MRSIKYALMHQLSKLPGISIFNICNTYKCTFNTYFYLIFLKYFTCIGHWNQIKCPKHMRESCWISDSAVWHWNVIQNFNKTKQKLNRSHFQHEGSLSWCKGADNMGHKVNTDWLISWHTYNNKCQYIHCKMTLVISTVHATWLAASPSGSTILRSSPVTRSHGVP